ncbi:hypothetical protein RJT34_09433 [Clitoria ternatea]|uniref:Polysaccharide biosynthesis domain-containing protein n=1 Tax=Clitoria ternatea TaxID=43366 RepID=A0AAN9K5S4_CLITE
MQPWASKSLLQPNNKKKHPHTPHSPHPCLLGLLAITVAATIFLFFYYHTSNLCVSSSNDIVPLTKSQAEVAAEFDTTPVALVTLLYYATAHVIPEQTKAEIRKPLDLLQSLAPCNFLVFGMGHDALMWDSFNPRGTTLFLEEDPRWTRFTLQRFPILRAHTVRYSTRLSDAHSLISSYKKDCSRAISIVDHPLKGHRGCPLALTDLPDEVYDHDWDVIFIDGPRGFFPGAPGRMSVIYSAAMMARWRKKSGVTHVFLHDVDREVEKLYAEEFLCIKYRLGGLRKLWHFVIPPAANATDITHGFC